MIKFTKVNLGDITINLDSKRKPLNEIEREKISKKKIFPYIGANNIVDYVDDYIFNEKILCIAEDGGSWGQGKQCAVIYNEKCWVNNHAHVLRETEQAKLEYLKHYLNYADLNNYITGTTRGKLTKSALNSIEVPLPSIEVQEKIAASLGAADTLIQKRKEAITKLNGLVESVFIEMFGEPVSNSKKLNQVAFGEVCEIKLGKMLDAKKIDGKNLYPYLGNKNVRWGHFDLIDLKEMDFNDKDQVTFSLQSGDLLICEGGEIGRAAIWKWDDKQIYYQKALHRARVKEDLATPEYLLYILWFFSKNNGFKDYQSSVTIAHLTAEKLKSMLVPLAPIQLQITFSRIYNQICLEKELMEHSLKKLEVNFQSLLHQAFTGRLQFRDSKVEDYALKR